jgi:hypothetical protein
MHKTSNPVPLTAKSMLPSWLKSPATSNSGVIKLPVRWLANADGRNAAERIKQARVENCTFFIFFYPLLLNLFYPLLLNLDLTDLAMSFDISIRKN